MEEASVNNTNDRLDTIYGGKIRLKTQQKEKKNIL
jgi:hypothetical protein